MLKMLVAVPCQLVQFGVTEARPVGGGTSGGSLRSSRQAAACHPFTRSWATMPPEPLPPSGLHRVGIVACLCINGGMRPRLVSGGIDFQ